MKISSALPFFLKLLCFSFQPCSPAINGNFVKLSQLQQANTHAGLSNPSRLAILTSARHNQPHHCLSIRRTFALRGGNFLNEDAVADSGSYLKSWRSLVNESTNIPYDIMASPLTPEEEQARLEKMQESFRPTNRGQPLLVREPRQHPEDGGNEGTDGKQAEENEEEEEEVGEGRRPEVGPDGTYGPPDDTGRRWKQVLPIYARSSSNLLVGSDFFLEITLPLHNYLKLTWSALNTLTNS
jgi:hypothetical protein